MPHRSIRFSNLQLSVLRYTAKYAQQNAQTCFQNTDFRCCGASQKVLSSIPVCIYTYAPLAHIGSYPRSVRIRAMLDVRSSVSVRTSLRVHTGVLVSPTCDVVSIFEGISEDYTPAHSAASTGTPLACNCGIYTREERRKRSYIAPPVTKTRNKKAQCNSWDDLIPGSIDTTAVIPVALQGDRENRTKRTKHKGRVIDKHKGVNSTTMTATRNIALGRP